MIMKKCKCKWDKRIEQIDNDRQYNIILLKYNRIESDQRSNQIKD